MPRMLLVGEGLLEDEPAVIAKKGKRKTSRKDSQIPRAGEWKKKTSGSMDKMREKYTLNRAWEHAASPTGRKQLLINIINEEEKPARVYDKHEK